MANPVFNRLETEWKQTTPAGYPTMPGYRPGAYSAPEAQSDPRHPYGAAGPVTGTAGTPPAFDQHALEDAERAYASAPADAVDRGRMTYDDVLVKTGLLFGALVLSAAGAWAVTAANNAAGAGLMMIGLLAGFVLAMVNIFSQTIRPALIVSYAVAEGVALGALSAVMEYMYPGIVVQALVATVAVFGVTLALFASGRVRNSSKLMRFTLIGLIGILVYRVLDWVLALTGVLQGGLSGATFMGIDLGLVVGVVAVLIGAMCLIGDFDQAKVGVARGVPAKFAWSCAFGMMVTVVWMYVEILNLLSYLRD
jgi:uncharacterized YccA/Bax inhibitor family protein